MANTLLGQMQYTYGINNPQTTTSGSLGGQTYYTIPWNQQGTTAQPYYYMMPGLSEAEKAGKALAIMKELQADGLINIDSVEKFCELIDKIASKI